MMIDFAQMVLITVVLLSIVGGVLGVGYKAFNNNKKKE